MAQRFTKIVTSPHYHLWSDALHGRELARKAANKWDRGTYVRWTVMTAWTVLEMACEDALGASGIGRRFREKLDEAVAVLSLPPLDWGSGIWQEVATLHQDRKEYVHLNVSQSRLFADVAEAEQAISVVREAVRFIYQHAGKLPPAWLADDTGRGWDRGPRSAAHATVIRARSGDDAEQQILISYVYNDQEFVDEVLPPDTDLSPVAIEAKIQDLLARAQRPISAIRVYRGSQLLEDRALQMRGA